MKTLKFEGQNGVHRAAGYQYTKPNPKAKKYSASALIKGAALPPKVDLRSLMTMVENQGQTSSCTANAIAGAYEYLLQKHLQKAMDVSRLFIYFNARWRDNAQDKDGGSRIQYGIESLKTFGACTENTWPFSPKIVTQKPDDRSYAEAAKFKALDMQRVNVDLKTWQRCLAEGYPIVFGCALFQTFDECNQRKGVVPMPDPSAVARGSHGLHAMLCVGYSDVDEVFIVRNSWGADWGVGGYCYIPYNYLMSKTLNNGDCWIVRSTDALPSPHVTWVEDDKPIIKGKINFEVNEFSKDDYNDVEISLFDPDDDQDYSDEEPEEYVEFAEAVETEDFVEDNDDYLTLEDEEEDAEEEDAYEEEDEEEEYEEDDTEEDEEDAEELEEEDDEEEDEDAEEEELEEEETAEEDAKKRNTRKTTPKKTRTPKKRNSKKKKSRKKTLKKRNTRKKKAKKKTKRKRKKKRMAAAATTTNNLRYR